MSENHWTVELEDAITDALITDSFYVVRDIDHDEDGPGVVAIWVEVEVAHIRRYITFDLSRRNLPEDWHTANAATGPGSPSYRWAERITPDYNKFSWDEEGTVHASLLGLVHGVQAQDGNNTPVDVAYVPLSPVRVLTALLSMKAEHHSWGTHDTRDGEPT